MRKDVYSQHAYEAWSALAHLKTAIRINNDPEEENISETEMFALIDCAMREVKELRDAALAKEG